MRGTIGVTIIVLASLCAAPVAAQNAEAARRAFDEASRQFDAGNHQLALDGFVESRRLMEGDARAQALILFNIARAQQELRLYDDALRSFQGYLDSAPSDAPFREQTIDMIRELRARGARSGSSSSEPSPLVIAGGVVAGIGALGALGAIPTGVLALDARAELQASCAGPSCPEAARGTIDEAQTLVLVTDVLWIAGVSLVAIGAALLGIGMAGGGEAPAASAFCTGDGCVATISASF